MRWRDRDPRATAAILGAMLWLVAGCGGGDTSGPAAAPRPNGGGGPPGAALAKATLVTIPPDSPQARAIKIEAVVSREVAVDEVVAPGRVGIDPNRLSRLLLPVPGRVVSVSVKVGDSVEQGQPVLALESPDADTAIAAFIQAHAAERQSEVALAKAQADSRRLSDLYEHQAVAQKDVLAAQNDVAQAKGALVTAQAARTQATRKLELLGLKPGDLRGLIGVRAPISGKVLEINVVAGEYRNDTGTPLMTIADLSRVWISSEVPESAIRRIQIGDRVAITLVAYPDETFTGRVARIADVLDPQTRTIKVHTEMPNPQGRFRPEMFGSIRHAGSSRRLPVIPLSALVQEYGRPIVFVERAPGQFERREITLGARAGDVAPVLAGVEPGDRVIVDGAVLLKDR